MHLATSHGNSVQTLVVTERAHPSVLFICSVKKGVNFNMANLAKANVEKWHDSTSGTHL